MQWNRYSYNGDFDQLLNRNYAIYLCFREIARSDQNDKLKVCLLSKISHASCKTFPLQAQYIFPPAWSPFLSLNNPKF